MTIKGTKHNKKRIYLSEEVKNSMVMQYRDAMDKGVMLTQKMLADKYGITQVAFSQILKKHGVKARSLIEANPASFDVEAAIKYYFSDPKISLSDVGKKFGVCGDVIRMKLVKRGIPTKQMSAYAKYSFNRNFFSTITPESAYWAGFLAADGNIDTPGLAVRIGIHPKDIELLNNFKLCTGVEVPIQSKINNGNHPFVSLVVSSKDWVIDLEKNFNVVPNKSLILKPPNITDLDLKWHFIRGVFDGDGSVGKSGTMINFISASPAFFNWILENCGKEPGHIQICMKQKKTSFDFYEAAQSAFYSGDSAREISSKMYKNSTPTTRLDRKFRRLITHPDSPLRQMFSDEV
jgi:hypothetical protein